MAKHAFIACSVVSAIALCAASVRLMPWITSPAVPMQASLAFGRALALAALEVALVVAAPLGVALCCSHMQSDGSLLTLHCLGVSRWRVRYHALAVAGCFAITTAGLSAVWASLSRRPGLLFNEIVDAGADACQHQTVVDVPTLGLSWLCLQNHPRIVGVASINGQAQLGWSARSLSFSNDLSTAVLTDVTAATRSPQMQLQVGTVTLTGLLPWLVSSPVPPLARSLACGLAVLFTTLGGCLGLLRMQTRSDVVAFAAGSSGPALFLVAAPWVLASAPWFGAIALPIAAGVAACLVACLVESIRLLIRWRDGTKQA